MLRLKPHPIIRALVIITGSLNCKVSILKPKHQPLNEGGNKLSTAELEVIFGRDKYHAQSKIREIHNDKDVIPGTAV